MESADLGIVRWDMDRMAWAVMFGDNFEFPRLTGEWQSPSIVMYDEDFNVAGVPVKTDDGLGIAKHARRQQLWDYPHNNPEFTTILPCDFIKLNGWWYVAAMVTAGLGNELRTVFWRSRDLVDWELTEPYVRIDHKPAGRNHPGLVMLTFDRVGDWIYIFGTGGLARNQPIWLWRSPVDEFPYGIWEPINNGQPVLGGRYGELSFRYIKGNSVLSFFDAGGYRQTALCVVAPEDDWSQANRVDYAFGQSTPQLYGGYVVSNGRLNESNGMQFLVSQWNTQHNDPYHVVLFEDTLQAKGPLVDVSEPVEPDELPKEPEGGMTPQELYEMLLRELSASGSEPIVTPEGDKLTLRQAIEQIFWKERGLHGVSGGRPRHPSEKDDQLGHLLSARTEGLFTQAVVVAIADRFNVDVKAIYEQVQENLK